MPPDQRKNPRHPPATRSTRQAICSAKGKVVQVTVRGSLTSMAPESKLIRV